MNFFLVRSFFVWVVLVLSQVFFCTPLAFQNWTPRALAAESGYGIFVGPPGLGIGQSNPITFQKVSEYKINYVWASGLEITVAPLGITLGQRTTFKSGAYVSLGAGLLQSASGLGPGFSSSFGIEFGCLGACLAVEYTQGLGISPKHRSAISPSALRLGFMLWTD